MSLHHEEKKQIQLMSKNTIISTQRYQQEKQTVGGVEEGDTEAFRWKSTPGDNWLRRERRGYSCERGGEGLERILHLAASRLLMLRALATPSQTL